MLSAAVLPHLEGGKGEWQGTISSFKLVFVWKTNYVISVHLNIPTTGQDERQQQSLSFKAVCYELLSYLQYTVLSTYFPKEQSLQRIKQTKPKAKVFSFLSVFWMLEFVITLFFPHAI